ncbi:hypothetical protein LPJ61_004119 [Coemansia biformis]|uniref:Uncharacterized protein n=1 Tax=Coemansia biformis TaxID=1286918 RepID=A0A9W8CUZ8_9FUNG|nr:hypothetical protein LPJ61_004119 [Coemansia biformis]
MGDQADISVVSCFFSAMMFIFSASVFCCMLSYVIMDMPKNAMSVAIGLAHSLGALASLFMTFLALPVGAKVPKSLPARHNPCFKQRILFLFHLTIGTLIISDPLFLKEKTPSSSNGITGVLYQLMIAGAAGQGACVVTTFIAQWVTPA